MFDRSSLAFRAQLSGTMNSDSLKYVIDELLLGHMESFPTVRKRRRVVMGANKLFRKQIMEF